MSDKKPAQPVVAPLPVKQWPDSLAHIVDDMKGNPINVHALMANNPALLKAWWNFRNYSVKGGSLGQRKAELVILRVAIHMGAWYEWGSHVERSIACGISLDEIYNVRQSVPGQDWSKEEGLLLQAVDQLVESHAIDEELLSSLNQHYSTEQLMDIIAIHGMYVILGCMINTWGLALDQRVFDKLPESVQKESQAPSFM